MSKRRTVSVKVLPNQPLDGSGKVCIHLVVKDERGPFVEPHMLCPAMDKDGKPIKQRLVSRPMRCRLACSATKSVEPVTRDGITNITARTDDPRAATCWKCLESTYYKDAMSMIASNQK